MPGPRANAPFLGGIVRRERSPKAQAVADAAGILNRDYAIAVEHRRGGRELALDVEQERCIAGQAEGAFADRRSIVPGEIDRFTAKIGQIGLCRIDKNDLPDAERVTRSEERRVGTESGSTG